MITFGDQPSFNDGVAAVEPVASLVAEAIRANAAAVEPRQARVPGLMDNLLQRLCSFVRRRKPGALSRDGGDNDAKCPVSITASARSISLAPD